MSIEVLRVNAIIRRYLPVRRGEVPATALMFLTIFGILMFYYILKPLRSGLFLKNFPSSHLPYAYFLTAFLAGSIATLFFKISRRVKTITIITITYLIVIATLFYFRWAMGRGIPYIPYVYFVYVQIVSVLSTAQFWLLAGYVFDNQQSKRIFPLLGSGAIAGAMAGSFVPGFLSSRLSSSAMLFICIAVCTCLLLLTRVAWRYKRPESELGQQRTKTFDEPSEKISDLIGLLRSSRHLLLIAVLVFLTLIASQISEWQVNDAAQEAFSALPKGDQERRINELFGRFYFVTNLAGITLQLFLSGFVVRRMGIGAAILFLPVSLFLGSMNVFIFPALWATVLALGSNSVFRYSVNRVGMELLYLPLSPEDRKKIKVFIDVFIDRFGRAIAGVIIIGLTAAAFGLRATALVIMLLTASCAALSVLLRRSYVDAFRQKLARRELDLSEAQRYVTDPAAISILLHALDSDQERQLVYALELLQSARGLSAGQSRILELVRHPSAAVREAAARCLVALPGDCQREAESLLGDSSEAVRIAAIDYLCSRDPAAASVRLRALIEVSGDARVKSAAARWVGAHPGCGYVPTRGFVEDLAAGSSEAQVDAAHLAATLQPPDALALLKRSLSSDQVEVRIAAAQSAANAGLVELVFDLLPLLTRSATRAASRAALLALGPRIAGTLGDCLSDSRQPISLRREVPWILGRIAEHRAADALIDNLSAEDPLLKYRIVKALNRMRELNPKLPERRPDIARRIYDETKAYCEALLLYGSLAQTSPAERPGLLARALRERVDQNLEIIFRLIGLEYSQKDIYSAYSALRDGRGDRRASAIEFLENVLHEDLKSIILPLVEESSMERLIAKAGRLFGMQMKGRIEALSQILDRGDTWLKACALHEIGDSDVRELGEQVRAHVSSPEPLIRETAEWAAARMA